MTNLKITVYSFIMAVMWTYAIASEASDVGKCDPDLRDYKLCRRTGHTPCSVTVGEGTLQVFYTCPEGNFQCTHRCGVPIVPTGNCVDIASNKDCSLLNKGECKAFNTCGLGKRMAKYACGVSEETCPFPCCCDGCPLAPGFFPQVPSCDDLGKITPDGSCPCICPSGYDDKRHPTFFQGCYKYISQAATWDDAQAFCQSEVAGGHLIEPKTKEIQQTIKSYSLSDVWLGGRRSDSNNEWQWQSDSSPIPKTGEANAFWSIFAPSNDADKDCLMNAANFDAWDNKDCTTTKKGFICEAPC